jgi:uncharacterized alpha-E superfamily protein
VGKVSVLLGIGQTTPVRNSAWEVKSAGSSSEKHQHTGSFVTIASSRATQHEMGASLLCALLRLAKGEVV